MAAPHPAPNRPLSGGTYQTWNEPWWRVYHNGPYIPSGDARRTYGPQARFDHHTPPSGTPDLCPQGRSVIYLAEEVGTCGFERFAEPREALICRNFHLALVGTTAPAKTQDIVGLGAVDIGAHHNLGSAEHPRPVTQEWAKAVYEDRPADPDICGIWYEAAHDGGKAIVLWETSPVLDLLADVSLRHDPTALGEFFVQMARRRIGVKLIDMVECIECEKEGLIPAGSRVPVD